MAVPEWAKVLAGSLALMIGASAPCLILESVSHFRSPIATATGSPSNLQHAERNIEPDQQNTQHAKKDGPTLLLHDPVAIATLLVALVTGALAFATFNTARDTRRGLYLQQRPKIRIRNVVVRPGGYPEQPFFPSELVSGQFYVVNIGGTVAQLIEAHFEVFWTSPGVHSLPMERPYEGKDPFYPHLTTRLQPGESTPLIFGSDRPLGDRESDQIKRGLLFIYVLGFVAFKDDLGTIRRTAFCRKYDYARHRFFAVDDPDYEHEE